LRLRHKLLLLPAAATQRCWQRHLLLLLLAAAAAVGHLMCDHPVFCKHALSAGFVHSSVELLILELC
jgi:hypothetical protein